MMRVISPSLQPCRLLLVEAHGDGRREGGVLAQLRVLGHEREGVLAGIGDDLLVITPPEAQVTHRVAASALARAEHVALAAQQQVDLGELEAVGGGGDLGESLRGQLPRSLRS